MSEVHAIQKPSRNISLDILKLLMAFMIVGLHAGFLNDVSSIASFLTVHGLFRVAVPIFLLISGFYFFYVVENKTVIFWLKRMLILYAVWMLVYSYFWFFIPNGSLFEIAKFLIEILVGYFHLWYIAGMIGAALLLLFLKNFNIKLMLFSVILLFLTGVAIQYLGNYHVFRSYSILDKLTNISWIHRNFLFFSFPFFCIGYLINQYAICERISKRVVVLVCFVGLICLLLESLLNYYQQTRDGGFDNYLSLIIVCPAIFTLFMKLNVLGHGKGIAMYAAAIYFIHAMILNLFWASNINLGGTLITLFTIITSAIAAYFIVAINKKVKFLL